MHRAFVFAIAALLVIAAGPVGAQELPVLEPGVATYVPLVDAIVIDGDLADWSNLPTVVTSTGPTPPSDPADTGSITWQIAAVGETLAFSASVVDSTIVAGQHGDDYWNEDSLELYVNFSGDVQATSYGPGIAQITLSPIDIGNTDPDALTITGDNPMVAAISGFVFATNNGWGVEVALDLNGLAVPSELGEFGLQVQANGSNGGDRDTKLSWSVADVNDQSFSDPSVFGTGIFLDETIDVPADAAPTDTSTNNVDAVLDDVVETDEVVPDLVIDESVTETAGDETAPASVDTTEPAQSRGLLIAAVVSATSIMAGGFWFEHRRKVDEDRRAEALRANEEQLALTPAELEGPK